MNPLHQGFFPLRDTFKSIHLLSFMQPSPHPQKDVNKKRVKSHIQHCNRCASLLIVWLWRVCSGSLIHHQLILRKLDWCLNTESYNKTHRHTSMRHYCCHITSADPFQKKTQPEILVYSHYSLRYEWKTGHRLISSSLTHRDTGRYENIHIFRVLTHFTKSNSSILKS